MSARIDTLASICRKFDVQDLYSFGSRSVELLGYVQGRVASLAGTPSDADIGVRFMRNSYPPPGRKVGLTYELEDFLGCGTVDLVLLEDCPPFLALEIIRGELLYAGDLDDQARYELFVMARAGDLMYYEKQRRKNILTVRDR